MGERAVVAAGGVVWRAGSGRPEVMVVHRPRRDDWSLPKGKAVRGEHPLATACREVREETGVRPVVGPRLPTQRYRCSRGPKVVHYWAMAAGGGRFVPSAEVDRALWLPVPAARRLLSHRRDVAVLDRLGRAVGVDAAVLLVRHAGTLRRVLPGFAPARLLCVPGGRRRGTLAPLGARLKLTVEREPALGGGGGGWPGRGLRRLRSLAREGGTTVVAAPGGAVHDLVVALARKDRVALPPTGAKKAAAWALFFSGGRLVAADCYRGRWRWG